MIFWVESGKEIDYETLISDLNSLSSNKKLVSYSFFLNLLKDMLSELEQTINSYDDLINALKTNCKNLKFQIYTTGTTSNPKKVDVLLSNAIRHVKEFDDKSARVWGMCYPEGTYASTQVFFQALFNKDSIIFTYNSNFSFVNELINDYKVTNLTCTPTFLKMLLMHSREQNSSVTRLTTGGEKVTESLLKELKKYFKNAEYLNVYATSETGSLLSSESEFFKIPKRYYKKIKILNKNIWVHKSLLNIKESIKIDSDWYNTEDQIEFLNEDKVFFKIKSRDSVFLNSGGSRISPYEIEEKILEIDGIEDVHVYGKKSSILGTIICAEVVSKKHNAKSIKLILRQSLEKHKIPQKISIVDTFTDLIKGKKKR